MRTTTLSRCARLFCAAAALAASLVPATAQKAAGQVDFSSESVSVLNIKMPYRCADIAAEEGGTPALVVYLHGGSSKGSDNTTQMGEKGIDSIANYLEAHRVRSLFLVPQCPSDKSWGGPMNNAVKAMIERYTAGGAADADRVYVFGGSMGGTGTWGLLSAYPGLFAAAMPVAGNPSKCVADNVAQTPVFTVMGTADAIMSVETAEDFIGQLARLGGEARMETEDGWTHEMTCVQSYTAERLDWVFSHVRGQTDGVAAPATDNTGTDAPAYYTLDGRRVPSPAASGIYLRAAWRADGSVTVQKVAVGR